MAAFNPCTLVTLAEARTITRGMITGRVEAPLGPTCIYRSSGVKASKTHFPRDITLAIEAFSNQASGLKPKRSRVVIAGHHGYCEKLGAQMVVLPLPGSQVLNVTAPCVIAQRFAAVALKRLPA